MISSNPCSTPIAKTSMTRTNDSLNHTAKKSLQRKEFLAIRNNISSKERIVQSRLIQDLLFESLEYQNARSVFLYLSVKSEVQTDLILQQAFKDKKRVAVPLCNTVHHTIQPIEITSDNMLEKGAYGIPEPKKQSVKNGFLSPIHNVDIAIIPAVAYDNKCRRLGMGGGYYDRFLSGYAGTSIGLAYTQSLADKIITDIYDQSVSMVITPNGIIYG